MKGTIARVSDLLKRVDPRGSAPATPLVALVVAWILAPEVSIGGHVDLFPYAAECPCEIPANAENIAGCPKGDSLWFRSESDTQNRHFELWCVDDSHFGLRFLTRNEQGTIINEKWVGLCPYGGGGNSAAGYNTAFAYKTPLEQGGFLWRTSGYISRDCRVDDDGDGKLDKVTYVFYVDPCELYGVHFEDNESVHNGMWSGPGIPGDPNSTEDGPILLLNLVPTDGALSLPKTTDDCPDPLETQTADVSVPSVTTSGLLFLLLLLILSGIYFIYHNRKGVASAQT